MKPSALNCFTSLTPEHQPQVPAIKRRRPTRSWFLFDCEGSDSPNHEWNHAYRLLFFAKDRLWIVTYAEVDRHAAKEWPAQVAAWCEAGADANVVEVATALLVAWRDACLEHGGPGIEFYHDYGELDLTYQQFCVGYCPERAVRPG